MLSPPCSPSSPGPRFLDKFDNVFFRIMEFGKHRLLRAKLTICCHEVLDGRICYKKGRQLLLSQFGGEEFKLIFLNSSDSTKMGIVKMILRLTEGSDVCVYEDFCLIVASVAFCKRTQQSLVFKSHLFCSLNKFLTFLATYINWNTHQLFNTFLLWSRFLKMHQFKSLRFHYVWVQTCTNSCTSLCILVS